MENGLYAAVKTEDTVRAVFVDQESLEFNQVRKMVKANRLERQQERTEQIEAAKRVWRAETARKRKFWRFVRRNVGQELFLASAMAAVFFGYSAGMVSAAFAFPTLAVLLAAFCFKAGSFISRIFVRR